MSRAIILDSEQILLDGAAECYACAVAGMTREEYAKAKREHEKLLAMANRAMWRYAVDGAEIERWRERWGINDQS